MPVASRFSLAPSALGLALALIALPATTTSGLAATTVISIAPGSESSFIGSMAIEDFEDVNLLAGLTITFSVWRNGVNAITGNAPVTYTGTLPGVWTPATDGFPQNAWDGTHALVNGWGHDWAYPFAASVEFQFPDAPAAIGIGLGNFQRDAASGNTFHTLFVNGVDKGKLESLPGWVSIVNGKNRYLFISGDEPITSVRFTADTHFDGLAFDKLAMGDLFVPTQSTTWGRLKSLYR